MTIRIFVNSHIEKCKQLRDIFFVLFLACFCLPFLHAQLAPNAEFATFTPVGPNGLTGTGMFGTLAGDCAAMPNFNYSITGDLDLGDTSVPGPAQMIDNNGGGFETIFGQADAAQNIEVEVAGYFGNPGDPITNTVTTTIDFDSPTPANELAFIIADVEQDQVMICALDASGNPVPVSVINSWFQSSFDAVNSDLATIPPTWDAATGTLVGQEGSSGVKQTNYQPDLPDNEAGAAWFLVNTSITQLQFKSQALGIAPDDPSQHFILASTCQLYDLALIKQEASAGPYMAGDDVVFDVTVCNQGNVTANNIEITDYIPAGMFLSPADANGWIGTPAGPVTNTIATLAPLTCATTEIILTIGQSFRGTTLVNNAEITADDGNDIDSTPGDSAQLDDLPDNDLFTETDGGDDIDPEQITVVAVYDLALIKEETSPGPYVPGDDVSYTISIFNQGTIDAGFIQISDYIPAGMTLSVADNNGWAGGPAGTVTNILSGPVAGGAPVTVDIVLTVDPTFTGGSLINNAEITSDNGDDIDSVPGNNSQPNDLADDNNTAETDGGDDEDPEEIVVCFCDDTASAGRMVYPGSTDGCIDDMGSTVSAVGTPTGDAVVPAGYELSYVISVGYDLQVVQCTDTPTFNTDEPGWFTIHPVVYDPSTFDPCDFVGTGAITELNRLFETDPCVCGNIDTLGVELGAYFCCMDTLQLDMNPLPPLIHDARIALFSKGTVNMPRSTTTLTGGEYVELQRGFEVMANSPLIVDIQPCSDIGN